MRVVMAQVGEPYYYEFFVYFGLRGQKQRRKTCVEELVAITVKQFSKSAFKSLDTNIEGEYI